MKRSNRGRPPRKESRHVVWLITSTLKLWNERKRNLGFTNKSNSVFTEALLARPPITQAMANRHQVVSI